MNRIVASVNGSIGTKSYEIDNDIRKSPPICGQKPAPVKCTRIVAPVPVDIRFSGVTRNINKEKVNKCSAVVLNKSTVKRRQSLDRMKDEFQSFLDNNLQECSKSISEKLNVDMISSSRFIDNCKIADDNNSVTSNSQNVITLSPTHINSIDKNYEKCNDISVIPAKKIQQQDQGKILSYIRQQRLKRKVQLKQEKNEKINMEQAKKQRLKELQDKTLKILADNIKHRRSDKKTKTTHSMIVPVRNADAEIVGKNIYMRGNLKSAKSSKAITVANDIKKHNTDENEGSNPIDNNNEMNLIKLEKLSATNILTEPHNITKSVTPVMIEHEKKPFEANQENSPKNLNNDRKLMPKILECPDNEKWLLLKRVVLIQAYVRGFLQRKKYNRIMKQKELLSMQHAKLPAPLSIIETDYKPDILPHYLQQGVMKPYPYNFITAIKKKINNAVIGSIPYSQKPSLSHTSVGSRTIKNNCTNSNSVESQSIKSNNGNIVKRSSSCDSKKLHTNREKYEIKCCHNKSYQENLSRRSISADSNSCSSRFKKEDLIKAVSENMSYKNSGDNVDLDYNDKNESKETTFANNIKTENKIVKSSSDISCSEKKSLDISQIKTDSFSNLNTIQHSMFDSSIKKLESPKSGVLTSNHEYENTFTKSSSKTQSKSNDFNSCEKNEKKKLSPCYNINVDDKLISDLKNLNELYTTFSAYVDVENNTSRDMSPITLEQCEKTELDDLSVTEDTNLKKTDAVISPKIIESPQSSLNSCKGKYNKNNSVTEGITEYKNFSVDDVNEEDIEKSSHDVRISLDASKIGTKSANEVLNNISDIETCSNIISEKTNNYNIISVPEDLNKYEKHSKQICNKILTDKNFLENKSSKTYSHLHYENNFTNSNTHSYNSNAKINLVYSQYSSEFDYSKSSNSSNIEKLNVPKDRLNFDARKFTKTDSFSRKRQTKENFDESVKSVVNNRKKSMEDLCASDNSTKNEDIKTVIKYIEDLKTLSKTLFESKDTQTSFKINRKEEKMELENEKTFRINNVKSLQSVASENELLELYIPPLDLSHMNSNNLNTSCSSYENIQNLQNTEKNHLNLATETESLVSIYVPEKNKKNNGLLSLSNLDKMLHDEYLKVLHLKSMLKKKEQTLIDRTKEEITMLENKKKELKMNGNVNEISSIKKKQRGLLLNLQHERNELDKMKRRYKKTYNERKQILKNNRRLFGKIDNQVINKREGELFLSKTRVNEITGVNYENTDNYSAMLSKREKELQRRRSYVETLLLWSRRLDEREKEITEMESHLQLTRQSCENVRNYPKKNLRMTEENFNVHSVVPKPECLQYSVEGDATFRDKNIINQNSKDFRNNPDKTCIDKCPQENNNLSLIDSRIDDHKNNVCPLENKSTRIFSTVNYNRPKYFVDNMQEQKPVCKTKNILNGPSSSCNKFYDDTFDREEYMALDEQRLIDGNTNANSGRLKDERIDINDRHIDLSLDKPDCVNNNTATNQDVLNLNNKFVDISQVGSKDFKRIENNKPIDEKTEILSNLDKSVIETIQINSKISHFVQTDIDTVSKLKTDKCIQTCKFKKVKGSDLNRLWRHITGSKKKIYSDLKIYKMTKKDLEAFYEDAKKEAMVQFSENDDTILSIFHNSFSDDNSAQKMLTSEQNVQTYNSHKASENIVLDKTISKSIEEIFSRKELETQTLAKFAKNDNIITECIVTAFDDLSKSLNSRKRLKLEEHIRMNNKNTSKSKSYATDAIETCYDASKSIETISTGNIDKDILKSESMANDVLYSQSFENESRSQDNVHFNITSTSSNQIIETEAITNFSNDSDERNNASETDNFVKSISERSVEALNLKFLSNSSNKVEQSLKDMQFAESVISENVTMNQTLNEGILTSLSKGSEQLVEHSDLNLSNELCPRSSVKTELSKNLSPSTLNIKYSQTNSIHDSDKTMPKKLMVNLYSVNSKSYAKLNTSASEIIQSSHDSEEIDVSVYTKSESINLKSLSHECVNAENSTTNEKSIKQSHCEAEILDCSVKNEICLKSEKNCNKSEEIFVKSQESNSFAQNTNKVNLNNKSKNRNIKSEQTETDFLVDENIDTISEFSNYDHLTNENQNGRISSKHSNSKGEKCKSLSSTNTCNKSIIKEKQIVYYFTEIKTNDDFSHKAESSIRYNDNENLADPEKLTSSSDILSNLPQEITLEKLDDILKSDYANSLTSDYTSLDKIYRENEHVIKSENSNGSILDSPIEKQSHITTCLDKITDTNITYSKKNSAKNNSFNNLSEHDASSNVYDSKISSSSNGNRNVICKKDTIENHENITNKENHFVNKPIDFSENSFATVTLSNDTFGNLQFSNCPRKFYRSLDEDLHKISSTNDQIKLEIAQDLISSNLLEMKHSGHNLELANIVKKKNINTLVENDLEKGLLKIDSGLKYLNDTFEKIPVLDKLSTSSQICPLDFENNSYTTNESVSYLHLKENVKQKQLSEPIERKVSKVLFNCDIQKLIDYQNLSPRGKGHNFFQFTHSNENNLEQSLTSKSNVRPEFIFTRGKNLMGLHIEPTIFETASEDKYSVKNSENSLVVEKSLDETGDFQKVEDVSCIDLMLNDTAKSNVDYGSNEIPEEIFWYEDEHEGSFKENDQKTDGTSDFGFKGDIDNLIKSKTPEKTEIDNMSGEQVKETSEVIERVKQIMETRNKPDVINKNFSKSSLRLQDLWITTNESLTPSPGNSPPISPGISQLNSEAEELRKKQLEIELEIKRLQQQSEAPAEFYVREIPNKPPPPYTPPMKSLSCEQLENNVITQVDDNVILHTTSLSATDFLKPLSQDHIETLIIEYTRILYDSFINGKITVSEYNASSESNINEKLVFDLCKEVIIEHFKYTSEVPIWLKGKQQFPHKNVYYNLDDLTEFVRKKILQFMNLDTELNNTRVSSKVRYSKEGAREIIIERSNWRIKDYDYELLCKENVTNCIMNMLLTETADVVSESFRRKMAATNLSLDYQASSTKE